MIPGAAAVVVGGVPLVLLPQRGAWWPARRWLLVADVHLGKAATFRTLGVPVPCGTTSATLGRLDALVDELAPARLVVLGDLLHGPQERASAAIDALAAWRLRRPALEFTLVRGNHDDRAGDPPVRCGVDALDGPLAADGLLLCHAPDDAPAGAGGHVLAGHLHPGYRLATRADALRLACFWLRPQVTVLPAFGEFTGRMAIRPAADDRVFVTDGQAVHEVPRRRQAGGSARVSRAAPSASASRCP